jgi:Asp-tRNA(Asn)/Glu-tRNA(Gln) amidotransferase A subunit family amidase
MGRSVLDAYLLLRAQLHIDRRDPFSSHDSHTLPGRLAGADLSALKVAFTPDLGCAPVDKGIAGIFRSRVNAFASVFGEATETAPDFSGVHEIFEVHRGVAFVTAHQDKLASSRDLLDRNVTDNTERGLKLTVSEIGRAYVEQTKLYKRVLAFFEDHDVLIAPAASVSPFPHSQLFVEEINGERMPTYMRWLALTYAPTQALCCSCVLPCGLDHKGMPFGIQVIGPKGGDAHVLKVALALEQVLAGNPETSRPRPDLSRLD